MFLCARCCLATNKLYTTFLPFFCQFCFNKIYVFIYLVLLGSQQTLQHFFLPVLLQQNMFSFTQCCARQPTHHFFALKIYVSSFASYQQRLQFSLSPTLHYHHSPFKSLQYHHCNSGQHTQLRQQTNAIVIIDEPHPKTSLFDLRFI